MKKEDKALEFLYHIGRLHGLADLLKMRGNWTKSEKKRFSEVVKYLFENVDLVKTF